MASVVAFPLSCLASILTGCWLDKQHSNISNTTISAPSPLPSPAEGALFADIAAPSVDNIESFSTMDLPVHVLTVTSSSLEASSSSFPFALVAVLAFLISCFLYFGYLFSDFDPSGAIQYGEDLLDASIDDLEHGPRATRVEPLDTDQVELKHHLDRLELFVDSLLEAESKAKKSEADAKAAIGKAQSEMSSVQAELDNVKTSLAATSKQRDKAHSHVSGITGENEKLVAAQQALQKQIISLSADIDTMRQDSTRKASEAAQTSKSELRSARTKHAELTDQTNRLQSDKEALQSQLAETKHELMMESTRRGNERKLHALGQERAAQQKEEYDAALARCESLRKQLREKTVTNTEDLQERLRSRESELLVAQERIKEFEKQSEADRNELQSGDSERQDLRNQLHTAQQALGSANTSAAELQEANARLNESNGDLQKRLQTAAQSLRSNIEESNANQMSLGAKLLNTEAERDSMRKELEKLRSSQQPGSQQLEKIQRLTDENAVYEGRIIELDILKSEAELNLEAAQAQLAAAETANLQDSSELKRALFAAENERNSAHEQLKVLRSSAQQGNYMLDLLQNEVEQLKQKLKDAEALHKADQDQLKSLKSQLADARKMCAKLLKAGSESEDEDMNGNDDENDDDDGNDKDDGNVGMPHSEGKDQGEDGGSQPDEGEDEDAEYADDDDNSFYGSRNNHVSTQEEERAVTQLAFESTTPANDATPPASAVTATANGLTAAAHGLTITANGPSNATPSHPATNGTTAPAPTPRGTPGNRQRQNRKQENRKKAARNAARALEQAPQFASPSSTLDAQGGVFTFTVTDTTRQDPIPLFATPSTNDRSAQSTTRSQSGGPAYDFNFTNV